MYGTFYAPNDYRNYLEHHGILGMKWGVRRFQNADGSYNSAGKKRYGIGDGESYEGVKGGGKTSLRSAYHRARAAGHQRAAAGIRKDAEGLRKSGFNKEADAVEAVAKRHEQKANAHTAKMQQMQNVTPEEKAARNARIKKVAMAVAGTAAVAAGTYFAAKYYKKSMAEAQSIMRNEKYHQVRKALNSVSIADLRVQDAKARLSVVKAQGEEHSERGRFYAKAVNEQLANKKALMDHADRVNFGMEHNIANKRVRRAAQKEIVKRDIANAKLNAYEKYRKLKKRPVDKVSDDWARGLNNERARARIEDLAILGENSQRLKKRRR